MIRQARHLPSMIGLFLIVAASACASDVENGSPDDDDGLETYQTWERECILWIRADCAKARSCDIGPAADCNDSDAELRETCRQMVAADSCSRPDAGSFLRCRQRTEGETCEEYCDSDFCFNFCFYTCLDRALDSTSPETQAASWDTGSREGEQ